jgi:anaerobic magnesium-protoporphyrin IX monomethyl ester cyclase
LAINILFVINQLDFADHIAISYLSGVARERKHKRYFCSLDASKLTSVIEEIQPEIVAYSVNIAGAKTIIAEHKKAKANHKFISIMGGPFPTCFPESFNESGMDAYCIGEGELSFDEFLKCVENNEPFDNVPNLITINKKNEIRPLIGDLDTIPFPDRDLVLANSFLKDTPKKTFYATRGCPYNCYYCCNNTYHSIYHKKGKLFRRFSVDRIIEEIRYVKGKYRTEFIKFGDDLFAIEPDEWLQKFADRYKKEINIPFNCYLRVDRISNDLLVLLKSAGCYSVHLSIDSTSEHVREKVFGRKMIKTDIEKNIRMLSDFGINTWVNFMLAAPESTIGDDLETIKFGRRARITYSAYSITDPMRGTKLLTDCIDKGLLDKNYAGDMGMTNNKSPLTCFSDTEKNIQYNIFCLGPVLSFLPVSLYGFLRFLIYFPPNRFFEWVRKKYHKYSIENRIFKLRI